jgi:hypothetical protein
VVPLEAAACASGVEVQLGRTRVSARIAAEIVQPFPDRPTEGMYLFHTELSPMASPYFENSARCVFFCTVTWFSVLVCALSLRACLYVEMEVCGFVFLSVYRHVCHSVSQGVGLYLPHRLSMPIRATQCIHAKC